jgi:A/G-specific adenine glycosylase
MNFSNTLIYWYLQTKRDLPWRKTRDPYLVWLSEIILQQTRVSQGVSYYLAFSSVFPTVEDLANAKESKVLKMWQGLGYYSRARNLHFTAKYISNELCGKFPTSYHELIKLKGIGDYTASAISSICFDEPAAVVDGNVYRVLARVFNIDTPINSTKGIKEFKTLAQSLLDIKKPGIYNQAIMDFGALQCKPKSPNCYECPMGSNCIAFEKKLVKDLPVKEKKLKVKKKYFNFFVFVTKDRKTIFEERTGNGIWQGLYQFPLIETVKETHIEDLVNLSDFQALVPKNATIQLFNEHSIVHKLSHQHLFTKFWIIKTDHYDRATINWDSLELFPTSVLIANFMKEFNSKFNQNF